MKSARNRLLFGLLGYFVGTVAVHAATLDFSGNYSWETLSASTAVIRVDRITNNSSSGTSGSLRLELWATTSAYSGGTISGYKLAQHNLTPLNAGSSWVSVSSGTIAYSPPPTGTWHITLVLSEYTAVSGNNGYTIRDYGGFANRLVIGSGGGSGGGSGTYLQIGGQCTYTPGNNNTTVVLNVGEVRNNANNRTGSLRLELWATSSPYNGGGAVGYKLGQHSLNPLNAGSSYLNLSSGTIPFSPPPTGTWYITLIIAEYDGSNLNDGYVERDFINFPTPMVIASGSGGGGSGGGGGGTPPKLAAGGGTTFYISSDGKVWATGRNNYGQLGDGSTTDRLTPANVGVSIASVATGPDDFSFVVRTDGSMYATGRNEAGQLGDGTTTNRVNWTQVNTGVAAVAAGTDATLTLKTNGTLWVHGWNQYGSFGDGTTTSRLVPAQLATSVSAIAAGVDHAAFVRTDGSLWTMGRNNNGQLGDGTTTIRTAATKVVTSGVATVSAGYGHTVFLKTDGTLWGMGSNSSGQLGDGTSNNRTAPVQITSSVAAVSCGAYHTAFVKTDGSLWVMGYNINGALGDGTTTSRATPVRILSSGISAVSAGVYHTIFRKTDGTVWGMGANSGQLGDGTTTSRLTPVQVGTLSSGGGSGGNSSTTAVTQRVSPGGTAVFSTSLGSNASTYAQWHFNGRATGTYGGSLSVANARSAQTGLYFPVVTATGAFHADPQILGLSTTAKVADSGTEVGPNILHPNGNTYDQVLLTGGAATITADSSQVTRTSFLDLDGDIVQVEFSGAGTLSINLRYPDGPKFPEKYNQAVAYMDGVACLTITGADESTNVTVFTVGRSTAVNQALFYPGVTYGGIADVGFIAISSSNGKFGGIRASNASFLTIEGPTGIYAPGVTFTGPVYIGNISAADSATPMLRLGSASDVRITGGDLYQPNGRAVQVSGVSQLRFTAGQSSHGTSLAPQANRARLEENGVDVTSRIVVNP